MYTFFSSRPDIGQKHSYRYSQYSNDKVDHFTAVTTGNIFRRPSHQFFFQYTSLDFAKLMQRKDVCTRNCVDTGAAAHNSNNVCLTIWPNDITNTLAVILTHQ